MGQVDSKEILDDSFEMLLAAVSTVDDHRGWRPTLCAGWSARDLVFHLLGTPNEHSLPCTRHPQGPRTSTR